MKIEPLKLAGTYLISTDTHKDGRGFFRETVRTEWLREQLDWLPDELTWQQLSLSRSTYGVIRGIHCSTTQAKLVTCVSGRILDVVVDMRRNSPTFGQWQSVALTADEGKSIFMDVGIGHAFQSMTVDTVMQYATTQTWSPGHEITINPQGADLGITWPGYSHTLSDKDRHAPTLASHVAYGYALPYYESERYDANA